MRLAAVNADMASAAVPTLLGSPRCLIWPAATTRRKPMSGRHVLVLGGARSGKTAFAERLAMGAGVRPVYLATAEALDSEMRERVESHRRQREGRFATVEEPLALARAIDDAAAKHDVILVDCLTLWITNLLGAGRDVAEAVEQLATTLTRIESARVILVSNEVGLGIVPDNALARTFRDLAGSTHQRLAEICDDVYFVVAGLPMTFKGTAPGAS
jgi:adenosylcobinamide kinase/adenosylcobinamide-phosphate guanylyltransferase